MLSRECNGSAPAGWKSRDGRMWHPWVGQSEAGYYQPANQPAPPRRLSGLHRFRFRFGLNRNLRQEFLNRMQERFRRERLLNENHALPGRVIQKTVTGDEDDGNVRKLRLYNLHKFLTCQPWHFHVSNEHVYGSTELSQQCKRIHTVSRFEYLVTVELKEPPDVGPNGHLIVNQKNHALGWPCRRLLGLTEQPPDDFQPLLRFAHGCFSDALIGSHAFHHLDIRLIEDAAGSDDLDGRFAPPGQRPDN